MTDLPKDNLIVDINSVVNEIVSSDKPFEKLNKAKELYSHIINTKGEFEETEGLLDFTVNLGKYIDLMTTANNAYSFMKADTRSMFRMTTIQQSYLIMDIDTQLSEESEMLIEDSQKMINSFRDNSVFENNSTIASRILTFLERKGEISFKALGRKMALTLADKMKEVRAPNSPSDTKHNSELRFFLRNYLEDQIKDAITKLWKKGATYDKDKKNQALELFRDGFYKIAREKGLAKGLDGETNEKTKDEQKDLYNAVVKRIEAEFSGFYDRFSRLEDPTRSMYLDSIAGKTPDEYGQYSDGKWDNTSDGGLSHDERIAKDVIGTIHAVYKRTNEKIKEAENNGDSDEVTRLKKEFSDWVYEKIDPITRMDVDKESFGYEEAVESAKQIIKANKRLIRGIRGELLGRHWKVASREKKKGGVNPDIPNGSEFDNDSGKIFGAWTAADLEYLTAMGVPTSEIGASRSYLMNYKDAEFPENSPYLNKIVLRKTGKRPDENDPRMIAWLAKVGRAFGEGEPGMRTISRKTKKQGEKPTGPKTKEDVRKEGEEEEKKAREFRNQEFKSTKKAASIPTEKPIDPENISVNFNNPSYNSRFIKSKGTKSFPYIIKSVKNKEKDTGGSYNVGAEWSARAKKSGNYDEEKDEKKEKSETLARRILNSIRFLS